MVKDLSTQKHEALWNAQRPLFVLPTHVDTDMFAAACALGHALQKTGAVVTILCPRAMSDHAQFLIHDLCVVTSLEETTSYECIIPPELILEHVSYEIFKTGGGKIIFQLPKGMPGSSASIPPSFAITPAPPVFDRIVTLGAQDLAEIAPLFGEMHSLLLHVPIATLNWQPGSEAFGRWNMVYEQATVLSEVASLYLQETAPESITEHVATCLLAGIIAKTKHFRSELVTPHVLDLSANLVRAGADRLTIIEALYRTKTVNNLRLWGAACARLQEITPGVLFSELTTEDFLRTQSVSQDLLDIAVEVLQSSDQTKKILFFYPEKNTLCAYVVAKHPLDARDFMGALRTEGTRESAHHVFAQNETITHILSSLRPRS